RAGPERSLGICPPSAESIHGTETKTRESRGAAAPRARRVVPLRDRRRGLRRRRRGGYTCAAPACSPLLPRSARPLLPRRPHAARNEILNHSSSRNPPAERPHVIVYWNCAFVAGLSGRNLLGRPKSRDRTLTFPGKADRWHVNPCFYLARCTSAGEAEALGGIFDRIASPIDFQTILKIMRARVAIESSAGQRG